jgi:hypothetical protein
MGETFVGMLRNAMEAMRLWAEDAIADGERVPEPRTGEELKADPKVAAALQDAAALVVVPLILETGRSVRANLSLDSGLLRAIDDAAAARGLTRSAFMAKAAKEKISEEA